MSVMIAGHNYGHAVPAYPLLEELAERYGISRRAAHRCILTFLTDLVDLAEVGERLIVNTIHNPKVTDLDLWLEITDDAADLIRDSFAARVYTVRISITTDTVDGDYVSVAFTKKVDDGHQACEVKAMDPVATRCAGCGRLPCRVKMYLRPDGDKPHMDTDFADLILEGFGLRRITEWECGTGELCATAFD